MKLFLEPQHLASKTSTEEEADAQLGLTEVDYEEQTAGYQAAYSKLAASELAVVDPVAYVRDPQDFLGKELGRMKKENMPVDMLLGAVAGRGGNSNAFVDSIRRAGYLG